MENKKNIFRQFFEDENGVLSSMRLFSAIALFNAITLSWIGLINKVPAAEIVMQEIPWLIAAFVPKAIQKFAEAKEFYGALKKDKPNE